MKISYQSKNILTHVFLILLAITVLVPVIYIILISIGDNIVGTDTVIPESFSLDNYRKLFTETKFLSWIRNSVIVALCTMALSVFLVSVSVYVFSRLKFIGKEKLFNFILLIQIFPLTLSMVSLFRIFIAFDLLNKLQSLVLVDSVLASAGLILLAKGYFDTIPIELDEAAYLDGANRLQMLIKVTLPLAKPMFGIVAVQSFVISYNEYVLASAIMTRGLDSIPLAVGLQSLITGQYGTNWSVYCAGAILGSIPMMILFFALQRYFIGGLTEGGVKG
ncbi:MAG: ABC transporter permease subunit [Eubacteriales bacterium]|nr:ABC transporter permease subunit [Eubacteriales bacterium]